MSTETSKVVYRGERVEPLKVGVYVVENGVFTALPHVGNHADTFEWGYSGSGPADLAWSILAHHLGNQEQAERLHQRFKMDIIVGLPPDGFELPAWVVDAWCKAANLQPPTH